MVSPCARHIEYGYINVVPFFLGHRREKTMHCAFCKRSQDVVEKLISSPNDYGPVYICDQCVRVCFDAIVDAPAPSDGHSAEERRCSFCHKGSAVVRLQSSSGKSPNASICEECLAVCRDILQDIAPIRGR